MKGSNTIQASILFLVGVVVVNARRKIRGWICKQWSYPVHWNIWICTETGQSRIWNANPSGKLVKFVLNIQFLWLFIPNDSMSKRICQR